MSTQKAERGTLRDTYHAALQHNHVEPGEDDLGLGVVREPMYGIQTHLDDNWTILAPPREALMEFKDRADEIGHNEAVDELDFDARYRELITTDDEVRQAIDMVVGELKQGRDVWLVCYENTDDKFCHRSVLREVIEERLEEVC